MGVVVDAQQAPSASGLKGTEQSSTHLPKDLEEAHDYAVDISPKSSKSAEESELGSIASSIDDLAPPPTPPKKRTFNISLKVRVGGIALGCCAGTVNAVAFHAIGSFVSHQTGSFSRVGLGNMDALLLVASFVGGALLCGLLVSEDIVPMRVKLYDICLILEAALLVATTFLADHWAAKFIAAASCGLQNALATHWGGAVTRTTHVTGLFTDVGLLFGRLLSMVANKCSGIAFDTVAVADDLNKLSVLGSIALAYLIGIIFGTHSFAVIGHLAFLIPAAAVGFVGVAYLFFRIFGQCLCPSVANDETVMTRAMSATWSFNQWNRRGAKTDGPPVMTRMGSSIV
jgi:uncharacterized membrane protein YoaK (UPF0700 family)